MGTHQQDLYEGLVAAHAEQKQSDKSNIFMVLKKAANHPLLLRNTYTDEKLNRITEVCIAHHYFGSKVLDFDKNKAALMKMSDYDLHLVCMDLRNYLSDLILPREKLYDSPKLCWMKTHLPNMIGEGHRILIFSQWVKLLDLVEILLKDLNIRFLRMDGKETDVGRRQELVNEFSEAAPEGQLYSIPVFLLTTGVGGLGLNLTAADTVILHDIDFNPENDRQAEDRAHRIGQTKEVKVFKLVTAGSVDEDIFKMAERKTELTEAVLSDNNGDKKKSSEISIISRILQSALERHKDRGQK